MKANPKNRLLTRSSFLGASLPAIFTVVLAASAHAATATWDGATNTNWNADNWSGGAGALGVPLANDILQFSGNGGTAGSTTVNNFAAATQFNGINFTNNGTGGATNTAFSLSGASITLGGNMVATSSTAAIQDTISNDLLIGATRGVTANGNHTIALTGAITINGANNTVLSFNNAAALSGAGGAINLNSTNATLTYNTTTATSLALSRAINANSGAHLSNTSADAAATIIYSGTFTGTANTFVLNGSNTGANDFQSAIGAGAATILLKAGNGSWTVSGLMSSTAGTGVSGVTGNLTLSNNSNSYTGQTTVSAGTLHIATIADYGTNSAVGKGTSGTALRLGNNNTSGILNYTGTGNSTNRTILIGAGTNSVVQTGSATIQNNGSNGGTGLQFTALTSSTAFNPTIASTTANRTLTLAGANTDANEIQGMIQNNTASTGLVAVTKADAGTWTLSGTNTYSGATLINTGILQLGNGSTTGALTGTSGITNNGTLIVNRSNSFTQLTDLNNKAITGSGSFTQAGAGTTTLSGTNTYTGATLITAGTLKLDATGTINNTSEVSLGTVGTFDVSAKGLGGYTVETLKGSGNVTGALTVSTTLAIGNLPGNLPGTTHFSSGLTLDSATYVYEMTGGVAPGTGSADLGNIAGALTITTGSILDLVELGTYAANNKFTLFGYGTLSGTFNGLANNDTFSDDLANTWRIKYDDTTAGANGGTGTNFVTITAIPEPNVAALLGGLGTLVLLRRRR